MAWAAGAATELIRVSSPRSWCAHANVWCSAPTSIPKSRCDYCRLAIANCWSRRNRFSVGKSNAIKFLCSLIWICTPLFIGSSTACILILNRETSTVYTANIGDSGFMVVRRGEIVHRSEEQQHYFNTPFQLSLPPPGHGDNVLSDRPESADQLSFPVLDGDVILVATDGVFDNVPTNLLLNTLTEVSFVRLISIFVCRYLCICFLDGWFLSAKANGTRLSCRWRPMRLLWWPDRCRSTASLCRPSRWTRAETIFTRLVSAHISQT